MPIIEVFGKPTAAYSAILMDYNTENYITSYKRGLSPFSADARIFTFKDLFHYLTFNRKYEDIIILLLPYFNWNDRTEKISICDDIFQSSDYKKFNKSTALDDAIYYIQHNEVRITKKEVKQPINSQRRIADIQSYESSNPRNLLPIDDYSFEWKDRTDFSQLIEFNVEGENFMLDIISTDDFKQVVFGSDGYKVPTTGRYCICHHKDIPSYIVGTNITFDVTLLKTHQIMNAIEEFLYFYEESFPYEFRPSRDGDYNMRKYGFDLKHVYHLKNLSIAVCLREEEDGLYLNAGLFPSNMDYLYSIKNFHYSFDEFNTNFKEELKRRKLRQYNPTLLTLTFMREPKEIYRSTIKRWLNLHKSTIESKYHREYEWWDRNVSKISNPPENQNLLYLAYIPETKILKVGRTQNWKHRENAYRKSGGKTDLTKGKDMRLIYHFETPETNDSIVDKYILFCAEDCLKNFVKQDLQLVEGNEFFDASNINVQDFSERIHDYLSKQTIPDFLKNRNAQQMKRFASNKHYDFEKVYAKLTHYLNESES